MRSLVLVFGILVVMIEGFAQLSLEGPPSAVYMGPPAPERALYPVHGLAGDEFLLSLFVRSQSQLPESDFSLASCHPPTGTDFYDPKMFSERISASDWRTVQELHINGVEGGRAARLQYYERTLGQGHLPLRAYLITVFNHRKSFSFPPLIPPTTSIEKLSVMAASTPSLVAVNGGYFSDRSLSFIGSQGHAVSVPRNILERAYTRDNGMVHPTEFHVARAAFGFQPNGDFDMNWMYPVMNEDRSRLSYLLALEQPLPNIIGNPAFDIPDYAALFSRPFVFESGVGGGPMLIYDGVEKITLAEELFWGEGDIDPWARQPRTAMGYTGDTLFILVVEGRAKGLSCSLTLR